MDKWTDNVIRQHIEELIEESYLRSLSEEDLQRHLRGFIKACESVIRENVTLRGDIRVTKIKVSLLRAYLLLTGNRNRAPASPVEDVRSGTDHLARQVLTIKRSVLSLLGMISPRLASEVLERTKPADPERGPVDGVVESVLEGPVEGAEWGQVDDAVNGPEEGAVDGAVDGAVEKLPERRSSRVLPVVGFYGFAAAVLLMVALAVFG